MSREWLCVREYKEKNLQFGTIKGKLFSHHDNFNDNFPHCERNKLLTHSNKKPREVDCLSKNQSKPTSAVFHCHHDLVVVGCLCPLWSLLTTGFLSLGEGRNCRVWVWRGEGDRKNTVVWLVWWLGLCLVRVGGWIYYSANLPRFEGVSKSLKTFSSVRLLVPITWEIFKYGKCSYEKRRSGWKW